MSNVSWIKRIWISLDKLEEKRFQVCVLVFSISIIPASIALSFALLSGSDLFLLLILGFSVLTLAFTIALAPVKLILLGAILAFITSISAVIYGLAAHPDLIKPYLNCFLL